MIFILSISYFDTFADQFFSGYSFFNNYSARTLYQGRVQMSTQGRVYRKGDVYEDGTHLINASGVIGANWAYSNNLELGLNLVFYQDIHRNAADVGDSSDEILQNTPDGVYIRLKYGNNKFDVGNDMLAMWALSTSFRFSSKEANIKLEPYSNEATQFNLTGTFSLFFDPLYYDEGQSLHFNLGYINHNDAAAYGTSTAFTDATMELTYGIAYSYPTSYINYNFEIYGNAFIKYFEQYDEATSNIAPYSVEPFLYVTPSIKYKAFAGLDFDFGVDVLAWTEYSDYAEVPHSPEKNTEVPYYPEWRLLLRANYYPSTPYVDVPTFSSTTSAKNKIVNSGLVGSRKDLFEWIIEEPDRIELIDMKLEKARAERKKIEERVDRLKEEVEEK